MIERLRRTTLFAAYQTALALGIVTFPLALLTERVGLSLPIDTLVERLGEAHERATDT
ncbi:hypothetical protein [Halococcus agarilyticus]|uniref:hypothetical protein n=1 Tax=Halococcus agarilyticus TaxID=1232219 RepID=UPI000ABD6DC0|nr:hypothetical protein [Halococcus agarilyticus]